MNQWKYFRLHIATKTVDECTFDTENSSVEVATREQFLELVNRWNRQDINNWKYWAD